MMNRRRVRIFLAYIAIMIGILFGIVGIGVAMYYCPKVTWTCLGIGWLSYLFWALWKLAGLQMGEKS